MEAIYYESSLCHHGIKGQKWGVRRFQNEDGSLTSKGEKRYNDGNGTPSRGAKPKRDFKATMRKVGNRLMEAGAAQAAAQERANAANALLRGDLSGMMKAKVKADQYKSAQDSYKQQRGETSREKAIRERREAKAASKKVSEGQAKAKSFMNKMGNRLMEAGAAQAAAEERAKSVNALLSGDFGSMYTSKLKADQYESARNEYKSRR